MLDELLLANIEQEAEGLVNTGVVKDYQYSDFSRVIFVSFYLLKQNEIVDINSDGNNFML